MVTLFCCLNKHNKSKFQISQNCYLPNAWRLEFLVKKILGFLKFFAKILAIFLGHVRKIFQDFSNRGKKSKKIIGVLGKETKNIQDLGKETKNIQDLGKRNKKFFHQSNTRSIDIL